jgi:hypothetical protein
MHGRLAQIGNFPAKRAATCRAADIARASGAHGVVRSRIGARAFSLDSATQRCAAASPTSRARHCNALVIAMKHVQYEGNPPAVWDREGIMDELIARLVANVGVDKATAEKAVGIILDFLNKEGPPDKVQALLDRMPGAQALIAAQQGADAGGMFGMGGIMGAGTKMMAAGLSMGQVQGVTKEVIAYAREKVGEDEIGEIVGAIPGLSQFV